MNRYRIWEAAREVFLYPENWLIESQRPNRTEIFAKLEQEIRQSDSTNDNLETVAQNYIAGSTNSLTCMSPARARTRRLARSTSSPAPGTIRRGITTGHSRSRLVGMGAGADQHQGPPGVPAVYRGRVCLFWLDIMV